MVNLPRVHAGKKVGNRNIFRTAVCAIAACGAGNKMSGFDDTAHFCDSFLFRFIKRSELLHIRYIILHLLKVAHSGQYHEYAVKAGGKAYCIACRTATVQVVEYLAGLVRKIYKISASDRLHDDYRLAVLSADIITTPSLNGRVVVIQIVELNLHDLNLRILKQYLVQYLRRIME